MKPSNPTLFLTQGQLELVAQDDAQLLIESLNLSGQHVWPASVQQNSIFLCSDGISQFSICAHYLVSLSTTEKSLALLSSFQPIRLNHLGKTPPSLSSPGWAASALSDFPHMEDAPVPSSHLCGPSLDWSSKSFLFLYWGTHGWTQCSRGGFSAEWRQKTISLHMLSIPFLAWPRGRLAAFAISLNHCLMVSLLFTKTLKSFSAGLFFGQPGHSM